ncbi:MAG: hypothetical protein GXP42_02430 [Chloroflexi bacterium]|nr:hypothetical protein [Chloroflexota bacterium]
MSLTKSDLTSYQKRWRAVADVETAERRSTSMTQRWEKLNALVRMAAGLNLRPTTDDEQMAWMRWNVLRRRYLEEKQRK